MPSLRNLYKLLDPEIRAKNLRAIRLAVRGLYWNRRATAGAGPDIRRRLLALGNDRHLRNDRHRAGAALVRLGDPRVLGGLWGPQSCDWESEAAGAEHARPEHRDAA